MVDIALIIPNAPFLADPLSFPHLGILYISASLKRAGYKPKVYDLTGDAKLPKINADVVGITASSPLFHSAIKIMNEIKQYNSDILFVIGGPHATVAPETCREAGFDVTILGEGEKAIVDLVRAFEDGWEKTPLVVKADPINPLDNLPYPDRDAIDMNKYHYYLYGEKCTNIQTQRGCSYACLPAGTMITLEDGSKKAIEKIVPGDMVWTYDKETLTKAPSRIVKTYSREVPLQGMVKLTISSYDKIKSRGEIRRLWLTSEHPIYIKDKGWIRADEVIQGDEVLSIWRAGSQKSKPNPKARERMLIHNPMRDPKIAARCAASLRKLFKERPEILSKIVSKGQHTRLYKQGGLSRGQKLLLEFVRALSNEEAVTEYPVRSYLCDVAIPKLKIDFEYDGHSRHWKLPQHDIKRDKELEKKGWLVVRIKNKEIFETDPHTVLDKISSAIGSRQKNRYKFIKVQRVYRMRDKERKTKVYDLSAEPAHTFVANGVLVSNCAFCCGRDVPSYRWARQRSVENVRGEIQLLKEKYGIRALMFFDDEFNLNKKHALEMCQMLQEEDIIWRAMIRSNLFDEELAKAMADAGCKELGCGVETGSPTIKRNINKGATIEQDFKARGLCGKYDIKFKCFIVVGLPGENYQTFNETREWIRKAQPDNFDYTILVPYPGSPIWNHPENYDIQFDKDEIIKSHFDDTFYKGETPSGVISFVSTSALSKEEIVRLRMELEKEFPRMISTPWSGTEKRVSNDY